MFYYLSQLTPLYSPLNLFHYITFRAGAAALLSLLLTLGVGPALIRALARRKIGQIPRTDGPKEHLSKKGTPTMGGLLICLGLWSSALLCMRWDERVTWILLSVTFVMAALGAWDDYAKLKGESAAGLSSRAKFAVQLAAAFALVLYLALRPPNPAFATSVSVPYAKELYLRLGPLYYALAVLLVVGSANAVNLTDGLDGLASGSSIFCAIAYGVVAYAAGNAKFSTYLKVIHVEGAGEISVFLAAVVGACLGFLWFNAYPAQVFMGDTGSLTLGGAIAASALLSKQELLFPIVGGIFLVEALSVMLQISSYKLRKGKRIFLMAPLHHHFELSGIAEPKVTVRFWIVSIVLMLTALASLKIR